jgi:hypothetical protein
MILTAIIVAGGLAHSEPINIMNEPYSAETLRQYEAYVNCFARGVFDRRSNAGSPEAHMREAKAACRTEYDGLVASMVRDSEGVSDATSATATARAFLDEMDARAVIGPPAPAALAQLPVERLVGSWRLGRGPLAVHMTVRFEGDGSLVGILNPPREYTANGLERWRIVGDGTRQAVLHASFDDGRVVRFDRIPSFPGEMNFVNSADASVQRIDLTMQDDDLLIRLTKTDTGEQLRFSRDLGTAADVIRD